MRGPPRKNGLVGGDCLGAHAVWVCRNGSAPPRFQGFRRLFPRSARASGIRVLAPTIRVQLMRAFQVTSKEQRMGVTFQPYCFHSDRYEYLAKRIFGYYSSNFCSRRMGRLRGNADALNIFEYGKLLGVGKRGEYGIDSAIVRWQLLNKK